jgi:hypothetical protein
MWFFVQECAAEIPFLSPVKIICLKFSFFYRYCRRFGWALYFVRTLYFVRPLYSTGLICGKTLEPNISSLGPRAMVACLTSWTRGLPSANAANSYLEFPASKSQKFGHWANIRPLLEKAKKLTICIGNSAPLKTFLLQIWKNLTTDFLGNKNYLLAPFELPG